MLNKTPRQSPGQVIVILGPTASGKSELAVKMALRLGSGQAEIISADSRQVYRGLNIGSGKITKKEMRGVPHHCLDIASPKKVFTAVDFKKCAEKAIKDIQSRGKTPIICGGTGFYISAITGGIDIPEVKPNWKLRKKLEKMPVEKLFKMLKKLNPERAKNIDKHNPRRLIRAIEITKNPPSVPPYKGGKITPSHDKGKVGKGFTFLGIKLPEKELKKRIEKRVKKMLKDGLLDEIKKLRKSGLPWKRFYELGFEYKYPAMFLQGKIGSKEMLEKMIIENRQYAKRQMTWFKKYAPKTKWVKKG